MRLKKTYDRNVILIILLSFLWIFLKLFIGLNIVLATSIILIIPMMYDFIFVKENEIKELMEEEEKFYIDGQKAYYISNDTEYYKIPIEERIKKLRNRTITYIILYSIALIIGLIMQINR